MDTYRESITAGSAKLNAGDTQGALQVFQDVAEQLGAKPTSEVLQLVGICWRMLDDAKRATWAFGRAYEVATNDVDKGRIMRDWAMVPLMQGKFDDAHKCLVESLNLLSGNDAIEYAVTWGFIGRVHAWSGDNLAAYIHFHGADMMLRTEHAPRIYELNNLIHWMEVVSLDERIKLAVRAVPIAVKYANRRRIEQIALLIICRPLAIRLTHA